MAQAVGVCVPASAIASFDPVESLGRDFMSRPGVVGSATYEFNSGMRGLHARYAGAEVALATLTVPDLVGSVQQVIPRPPLAWVLVDTYVSLFLFSAWSSIECLAYAVNALGFSISPGDFCDIDSERGLRGIAPKIIVGPQALPGFPRHFPSLTSCLVARSSDVQVLQQQHNVSKHRRAVAAGGQVNDRMRKALARAMGDDLANHVACQRASWDNILLDPEHCINAAVAPEPSEEASVLLHDQDCTEALDLVVCTEAPYEDEILQETRVRVLLRGEEGTSNDAEVVCDISPDVGAL